MPSEESAELLTPEQLANALQTGADTVLRWARAGRIPSIRASSHVIRFNKSAVLAALEREQATEAAP